MICVSVGGAGDGRNRLPVLCDDSHHLDEERALLRGPDEDLGVNDAFAVEGARLGEVTGQPDEAREHLCDV